ncbi:hypothetical protein OG21DRAFT_1489353 [Imleria badia]|nr:hypothetical protein OG21DRAFT_1489353 [Imleria badia]
MKDIEKLLVLSAGAAEDKEDETGSVVDAKLEGFGHGYVSYAMASYASNSLQERIWGWIHICMYVGPTGPVVLMLSLIMDWCRVLDEGHATLSTLLNIELFNLPAAPPNGIDVNSLMSVLLLQMLTNLSSGIIQPAAATAWPVVADLVIVQHSPRALGTPPSRQAMPALPPSPPHLKEFLVYAEAYFNVKDSACYEEPLRLKNIGPDVLTHVDEKTLSRIGISIGDIARLKRCSIAWWNGQPEEAKHKQSGTTSTSSNVEPTNHSRAWIVSPLRKKKTAYEKCYHGGGGCHFTVSMMKPGDADPGADYNLYYKCDTQNQWLPVPHGFVVIEDLVEDENEDNVPYPF